MEASHITGRDPGERWCPLDSGILVDFIRRARRRFIANQVYEQVILALGAGWAGLILLLLLGTQILDWYWPVLLFAAVLGVGGYRLRRRIPSEYQAAQRVDERLRLEDTLSTALYFLRHPERGQAAGVQGAQAASAARLARQLSVAEAVPWRLPRSIYASLALALVAGGMIGIRYGIDHRLDLRRPIANLQFDTFRAPKQVARAPRRGQNKKLDEQFKQVGLALDDEQDLNRQMERPNDSTQNAKDGEDNGAAKTKTEKRQERGLTSSDEQGPEQREGAEAADGQDRPAGANDQGAATNQPAKKGDKPENGRQGPDQDENNSLLEKMRNAMANMLAKMKMQPEAGQGQQVASASKGSLQNGQQQQAQMDPQGQPSQGKDGRQQQGRPSAESKGNQEGQAGQQQQQGEGQQGSNSSDKPSSNDSKTGMGRSNGNKDVKLAEQLEAMGKISEIIGKRSQSLTGEMMVEVASGKQQLKTGYTQRNATHGEAGGEIHRDEVPLALQQYVQQYFEEVRKFPPPSAAPKTKQPGAKGAAN